MVKNNNHDDRRRKAKVTEQQQNILALDIGGTFIKSGLIPLRGEAMEISPVPVDSNADRQKIIQSFADAISAGLRRANGPIIGIGIAIPGPFDYAKGVSLMKHKFASIYELDLTSPLRRLLPASAEIPIRFSHDANSFLTGEMWRGAGEGCRRVIGVTLGTGIGVAASIDGQVLTDELGSPADEVSLWDKPFKNGTVEDAVSTRAMLKKYLQVHPEYDQGGGVKGIADAAAAGDSQARKIFEELGDDLAEALRPLAERLQVRMIILGGQIAKSFPLFSPSMQSALQKMPHPPMVCLSKLGPLAQLYGAASPFQTGRRSNLSQ
jgi:glucokinase